MAQLFSLGHITRYEADDIPHRAAIGRVVCRYEHPSALFGTFRYLEFIGGGVLYSWDLCFPASQVAGILLFCYHVGSGISRSFACADDPQAFCMIFTLWPNHALQRTRPSRPGCNPRVPGAGSLSLGR